MVAMLDLGLKLTPEVNLLDFIMFVMPELKGIDNFEFLANWFEKSNLMCVFFFSI